MKRVEFSCYDDLIGTMQTLIEYSSENEYKIIEVIAKYDVVKNLLRELILYGEDIDGLIDLEEYEYSYYNKEFLLYLTEDGVSVERAWYKNKQDEQYYTSAGDVVFVHEDCNSKVLEYIDSDVILEFGFVDNDNSDKHACFDNEDYCEYQCCADCNKDVTKTTEELSDKIVKNEVSTKSKEQYFVNGRLATKEEYDKKSKELREKTEEFLDLWIPWKMFLGW